MERDEGRMTGNESDARYEQWMKDTLAMAVRAESRGDAARAAYLHGAARAMDDARQLALGAADRAERAQEEVDRMRERVREVERERGTLQRAHHMLLGEWEQARLKYAAGGES